MVEIQIPEKVNKIIHTLQEHGYEAYAVGGCVRDSFLGTNGLGYHDICDAGGNKGIIPTYI